MSNQVSAAVQHTAVQVAASEGAETGVGETGAVSPTTPREEAPSAKICGLNYMTAFKLFVVVSIITGIVLGLTVGDLDSRLTTFFQWLDDNMVEGIAIYISLYAALTGVFFPSSILTLAGGAIYSFTGIPIVFVGAVIGQTLAFLLARYLLRDIVKGWASKYTVWKGINGAIKEHPLKITVLVRLATVIPYSATNALLPITDLTLWQYTIGSAIGILPGVCLFVLIGHLAGSIADVSSGGMSEASSPAVVFTTVGVSIVVMVILVVLLTRYAKKALAEQIDKMDEEGTDDAAAEGEASEAQPAELDSTSAEEAPTETSVGISE